MSTIVERTASRKAGSDVSKRSSVKQVGNGTTANGLKKPDVDKNGHAQVYSNQAYDNDIAWALLLEAAVSRCGCSFFLDIAR